MAPQVVYHAASSLDGFLATPDGGVEWLDRFEASGDDHGIGAFYATIDGILMGSRTYEFALAHPPWQTTDRPTWVFTRRELAVAHESVTLTSEDPTSLVASLAERGHERLWLMGGGELAASFRAAGLITRWSIAVVPVVLGDGIPLVARQPEVEDLKLVQARPCADGIVLLDYEPAGPGAT